MTEDFETQPLDGWMLEGGMVERTERGAALVFHQPGVAICPATCGQSFTLTCRLRVQNGMASTVFCTSGDERQIREYQLLVDQGGAELVRKEGGADQVLGTGQTRLAGKGWARLGITRNGGQIQVSLDDQPIITAQDPNPLPAGGFAVGCSEGSGVAFDDIVLSGGTG